MISESLLESLLHGSATLESLRPELPEVSAEERKVLAFETQAMTLNAGYNGVAHEIRDSLMPERKRLLQELNTIARDPYFQRPARYIRETKGLTESQAYLLRIVQKDLESLAVINAKIQVMEEEKTRLHEKWIPIQRLAEGMRKEFDARRNLVLREEAASRPKLAMTMPENMPASDAIASVRTPETQANLPVVNVPQKLGGDWMENLQKNAYGTRNDD